MFYNLSMESKGSRKEIASVIDAEEKQRQDWEEKILPKEEEDIADIIVCD